LWGDASIWLVNITASAQGPKGYQSSAHSRLTLSAAQSRFPSTPTSHSCIVVSSSYHILFPSSLDDDAQGTQFMDLGPQKSVPSSLNDHETPSTPLRITGGSSRDEGFSLYLVTRSLRCFSLPLRWSHLIFSNTSFPQSVQLRSFLPFLITGSVLFRCYLIAFVLSVSK
jgi:hypothetical protein